MSVVAPLKFYIVQLRRLRPFLFAALTTSSVLFVVSALSWLVNHRELAAEETASTASRSPVQKPSQRSEAGKPLALPMFDSVVLVSAIGQASSSMKVSTDELTFALEEGASHPYRRYRASFSMLGRYPQMRAAIGQILREVPYSSLDSIKCTRDDISEVDVSCAVNMSAFYKRATSP